MKNISRKTISVFLSIIISLSLFTIPSSAAQNTTEIMNEINKLENDIKNVNNKIKSVQSDKKNKQNEKSLYDQKMSLIQSQINICNNEIRSINETIANNEKQIVKKEKEMETVIRDFKKRICSIYMNGSTDSGIEVLLGAETFSDFLALSQLTVNISKHDNKLMDDIKQMIKEINEKTAENKKLLESQKEIKTKLDQKYAEFDALAASVQSEIDDINDKAKELNDEKKDLQADLKAKEDYLNSLLNPTEVYKGTFDGTFAWPVPSCLNINSGYGSRWGTMHKGIDISGSGIRGKPVVASASGTVVKTYTACPHNYGKNSSCYNSSGARCGGGYGNHVVIQHGKSGSYYYQTLYGHLGSVSVKQGQTVKQGQVIGYVGSTGYSTGWHLHFEIHKSSDGKTFNHTNPEAYVKKTK